jgi:hypothetical protein
MRISHKEKKKKWVTIITPCHFILFFNYVEKQVRVEKEKKREFDKENVVFDEGVKSTFERESEPAMTKRRVNSTFSSIQEKADRVRVREEEDEMR